MSQKENGLLFANRLFEYLEIEVPERHSGGDGDGLPVEVILQHRRLTTGAQVRHRWGRWLNPLSSMKTIVSPSFSAFF
jgi:hypothetical protein